MLLSRRQSVAHLFDLPTIPSQLRDFIGSTPALVDMDSIAIEDLRLILCKLSAGSTTTTAYGTAVKAVSDDVWGVGISGSVDDLYATKSS